MSCRHCNNPLRHVFVDLGFAPPSNALRTVDDLNKSERCYPLRVYVCDHCWLVQTEDFARSEELFSPDYAYFSSVSQSWLDHVAQYTGMITEKLQLNPNSHVIEVAANDGYLLKNFIAAGIPCLGIEPTNSTAAAAEQAGIPIIRKFFDLGLAERLAGEGRHADLLIGNNVYAHVPDINGFSVALKTILKPGGTINLEFPHLKKLLEYTQFDTVYHEHFSYLSLHSLNCVFAEAGLRVYDVEELPTHGGSLRVYGCHADDPRPASERVGHLLGDEVSAGMQELSTYLAFQRRAERIKDDLLMFLVEQKRTGKKVAGYGAAAKGSTLLNFAGIKPDLLPYICDAAPSKQGKFLPGCHIPILEPEVLAERKPDIVIILPWNIQPEITRQLEYIRGWHAKFAVAVPELKVF